MKIDRLELFNFGSYEGFNSFDMRGSADKNIIVVGGKNGAGKTTLFNAIRLCLYGYMSFGYKSLNSNYIRIIKRYINNNSKTVKPAESYVKLNLMISNGQNYDNYVLIRKWIYDKSVDEIFSVYKNEVELNESERGDFEKYILNIIPPELFNLYFFDGEKIADFFLSDGSNVRIKNAFLTLCGYDTFEIMSNNFKRISKKKSKNSVLDDYLKAKEEYNLTLNNQTNISNEINQINDQISDCNASIDMIESTYKKSGGITEAEWSKKLDSLKDEERKRDELNSWIKSKANDILPFVLLKKQMIELDHQLRSERNSEVVDGFNEIISNDAIVKIINDEKVLNALKVEVEKIYGNSENKILNLSYDQNVKVAANIYDTLNFDESSFFKAKEKIRKSINKSAKVRDELEKSNINSVTEFLQQKNDLLNLKDSLQKELIEKIEQLHIVEKQLISTESSYKKIQKEFENEIKQSSINDISAKAILMLDKLQEELYKTQINKVQTIMLEKLCTLMRKDAFVDDIRIDDKFNISLYKNKYYSLSDINNLVSNLSKEMIIDAVGERAFNIINDGLPEKTDGVILPVEIDKNILSAGEKQIFIMSLYFSLVELCRNEVPFVIDTPFARIDKIHRKNIAKEFFSKLSGQVFILSTDEEITESHMKSMSEKIAITYLLENTDNKRTVITENKYF